MKFVKRVSISFVASVIGITGCNGEAARVVTVQGESGRAGSGAAGEAVRYDAHILTDQFGYRPADAKVAVIRTPHVGFDASNEFSPGSTYQVRRAGDGVVVYSGAPVAWNGGAIDNSAGDTGWWFDFSSVTAPGTYFIYDISRGVRSPLFTVDQRVYRNILKAAVHMFYYQRAGVEKAAPFAQACWVDDPAYLGPFQDGQARDITDPGNLAKVKDLSGGWFDAGDTNKYVTNASGPVHQLLTAYQEHPAAFTDDFNIPESGNGVPDILDEVKWETDWLKRMQYPDGSVALKVGDTAYTNTRPPSSDRTARYYVPSCSSSTITAAGMFAHAALVYGGVGPMGPEAADLKARAISAWKNYQSIPSRQTSCDSGAVKVGGSDLSAAVQEAEAVVAAIYLYAITEDSTFNDFVKANYRVLRPYHDIGWIRYSAEQGEALLFYTTLRKADPTLKRTILSDKLSDTKAGNEVYGFSATSDLYRNFLHDYIWGSSQVRANYGNSNMEVKSYGIDVASTVPYQNRALDTLHYFHGVNPFGIVYLSNMYQYGATNSVKALFSSMNWDVACGAAPGYVTGGPNRDAGANGVPASEVPPTAQPAQKSYKDWNGKDGSWVVNEPADSYQAAYVQLVAAFAE